jgi:predicted  nucleic acid-binding Zn-ribbon protein
VLEAAPPDDETPDDKNNESTGSVHPLLEIQEIDTRTEQLQHRRATLPLRRDLAAARSEQRELQRRIDTVGLQRIEVLTRQKRLEDEAAIIQAKADKDDNRLYSGEITAIRDLQALQDEIAGLRSRQGVLEEQAIEALVEAEELGSKAETLEEQRASGDERTTVLEAELAATEASIDEQLAALSCTRTTAAARAEASAVAEYERRRETFGPSTAVSFDPSSGCGCPQQMPAVEMARIKRCAEGEVLDCAECGRLVLR